MEKICQPLEFNDVNEHRRDNCIHYGGCLEEASAMLWPSFSCKNCKQFIASDNNVIYREKALSPLAWEV